MCPNVIQRYDKIQFFYATDEDTLFEEGSNGSDDNEASDTSNVVAESEDEDVEISQFKDLLSSMSDQKK